MRGLKKNRMERGHANTHADRLCDSMIESAQWADSMKMRDRQKLLDNRKTAVVKGFIHVLVPGPSQSVLVYVLFFLGSTVKTSFSPTYKGPW